MTEGAPPGRSRASPSISRLEEIDAAGERHLSGRSRVLCVVARRRTMFSMPLAYPSALDHRPLVAHIRNGRRPTWRGFGARASRADSEKSKLKLPLIASVPF